VRYIVIALGIALVFFLFRAYMPPRPNSAREDSSNKAVQQAFEMRIPNEVGAAWKKAWEESGEAPLFIRVPADDSKCSVRGNAIPCSDLVGHVERSLNLPKTTPIGLTAPPGQATILRANLADALKRSGYSLAAVIDVKPVTEPGAPIEESK
jgi:hypothetical protein